MSSADSSQSARADARWPVFGRVLISLLAIAFLVRNVTWLEVWSPFDQSLAHWRLLLVALLLPGVGLLFAVMRWKLLLAAQGSDVSIGRLVSASLVAAFFNQFLPSTIGGDFVRSRLIENSIGSGWLSLAIVALDRALGLLGICAFAFAAALLSPAIAQQIPEFWAAWALVSLGTLGTLALMYVVAGATQSERLPFGLASRVPSRVRLVAAAFVSYRQHKSRLAMALLLSMAVQLAIVSQYLVLMMAFGKAVPLMEFAVVVSVVTLIALVPLAINGIGLRESALAILGGRVGLTAGDAVALGTLLILALIPYALVGGVIYFKIRRQHSSAEQAGLLPLTSRKV